MNITTNDMVKRTYQELFEIWRHCLIGDRFTDPQEGVADELGTFFASIMRFFDRMRYNRVETAVGEQIQRLMVLTKKVLSRIARSIHGDP
jgi:hypothetical protein